MARVRAAVGQEVRFGESRLRGELAWELSWAPAVRFAPLRYELEPVQIVRRLQHSGGDVQVAALLGKAYVRLWFRNLVDAAWYRMPFYPQPGRSLVFELTWSFLD
jgi:hypothetical protein